MKFQKQQDAAVLKLRITLTDILFTLLLIIVTVFVSMHFVKKESGTYVRITTPKGVYLYSIEKNADYTFDGLLGKTTLRIQDGAVSFLESSCPNKTCLSKGGIHVEGDFNACLPNGISVYILGKEAGDTGVYSKTGEKADAVSI